MEKFAHPSSGSLANAHKLGRALRSTSETRGRQGSDPRWNNLQVMDMVEPIGDGHDQVPLPSCRLKMGRLLSKSSFAKTGAWGASGVAQWFLLSDSGGFGSRSMDRIQITCKQ